MIAEQTSIIDAVREAAQPLEGNARDYDPLLGLIGNASFCLLGEATHGTHEFYRERAYRGNRPEPDVRGKTIILVDDGLATGSTMRAAASALREQNPARIVVAVPVSAPQTCNEYRMGVDEIICAKTPDPFLGVGMWYSEFSQTTDEEVRELLAKADAMRTTEIDNRELVHT